TRRIGGGPRGRPAARADDAASWDRRPLPRHAGLTAVRPFLPDGSGKACYISQARPGAIRPRGGACGPFPNTALTAAVHAACRGGSLMSDQDEPIVIDDGSGGDRPLVIPPELPVLPLRDTVLYPNSFMPLAV